MSTDQLHFGPSQIEELIPDTAPLPRVKLIEWNVRHMHNEDGKPYSHGGYPHLGAPGGPSDAFDDPRIRVIVEQFASRLGKTYFGQCAQCYTADMAPAPMMFVSASETLSKKVIGRTYKLLANCRPLEDQLLREDLRGRDCIQLSKCQIDVGWALSPITLADRNVKIGHANEVDKWKRAKTSTEADPLKLFLERGKDFPNYKYIIESTPAAREMSRVESARLASTQCAYLVPCPHCRQYQPLVFQRIVWDRTASGGQDADLALRTARYVCSHCEKDLFDHDRRWMMRRGVWLAKGCSIDGAAAIETAERRMADLQAGRPLHDDRDRPFWQQPYALGQPERLSVAAGYQLNSLAALSLTWGTIAREWITSYPTPTDLQNFVNSWLGETWEAKKRAAEWEELGKRMVDHDTPRYVAPLMASLVCVGIDRQKDHYKYAVVAFGPGPTPDETLDHTLDYGVNVSLDAIITSVIQRTYQHADGGSIKVSRSLVDSGHDPEEPYRKSLECLRATPRTVLLACKGSSTPLHVPYRIRHTEKDTAFPGTPYVQVDGNWTQGLVERGIYFDDNRDTLSSVFNAPVAEHEDFLRQLLNEEQQASVDRSQHERLIWTRSNTSYPNDFRDCVRYWPRVAQLIYTNGKPPAARVKDPIPQINMPRQPGIKMPDGRPWIPKR